MKFLRHNLEAQFAVFSFVITAGIAVAMELILDRQLNHVIESIQGHGAAMMAGTLNTESEFSIPHIAGKVVETRVTAAIAFAVGFLILFAALIGLFRRASRTIRRQDEERRKLDRQVQHAQAVEFRGCQIVGRITSFPSSYTCCCLHYPLG